MTPPRVHRRDDRVTVHHGEALDVLRTMPDASVHSVVCDPPYGLSDISPARAVAAITAWAAGQRDLVPDGRGFMGHDWDAFVPPPAIWDECLRVLKPGGHLLAFSGARTHDLMTLSIRFAGFEIRDSIAWLYGNGFPKSLDVGKAIDKSAGATRQAVGPYVAPDGKSRPNSVTDADFRSRAYQRSQGYRPDGNEYPAEALNGTPKTLTAPATLAAQQWDGWGTALKPGHEPIVVARKPLTGTVAANVLAHETGALNIDGCRTEGRERTNYGLANATRSHGATYGVPTASANFDASKGRWPANVVLDGDAAEQLNRQSGRLRPGERPARRSGIGYHDNDRLRSGTSGQREVVDAGGGASRFFPVFRYQAKASPRERPSYTNADGKKVAHSTVKPLALMRWLARLVTPPGGTVLDWCTGSGTTLEAALLEGFDAIGIERYAPYLPLIDIRLDRIERDLFTPEVTA